MQQTRIKNTKLIQKTTTWKTGWCSFYITKIQKGRELTFWKKVEVRSWVGIQQAVDQNDLHFQCHSSLIQFLKREQVCPGAFRDIQDIQFFSYFSSCLYRWILAIKASIKKWLPLHQALQDYMSRPHEETRMWDAVHSVKPDLTHPADHWTNHLFPALPACHLVVPSYKQLRVKTNAEKDITSDFVLYSLLHFPTVTGEQNRWIHVRTQARNEEWS